MFTWWLAWREMRAGKGLLNPTSILSIAGMAFGVAALVVVMAVFSGYETTLKKSIIDVFGHLQVVKRTGGIDDFEKLRSDLGELSSEFRAMAPFVLVDAVLAHEKKLAGVLLEGIDLKSTRQVLQLEARLRQGQLELGRVNDVPKALIGKGIAQRFALKVGDTFNLVIPLPDAYDREGFRPRARRFLVAGVLDLGRHDFDERYVLTDLAEAQEFARLPGQVMGFHALVAFPEDAERVANLLNDRLGYFYRARTWRSVHSNIFRAVEVEKPVLFVVISIMLIAACFNIASTLFVSVLKRYPDISILKAMGARPGFIWRVFTIQGLLTGLVGTVLGLCLGLVACYGFVLAQSIWGLIPSEVYKLDFIRVDLRLFDLFLIFTVSLTICFLSTLAPALRGARLDPIEGLQYE